MALRQGMGTHNPWVHKRSSLNINLRAGECVGSVFLVGGLRRIFSERMCRIFAAL